MKKLLIAAMIFLAASCSKDIKQLLVAHVSATTYFLFPGATYPVVQAIADIPLPGDSAIVEYKGNIYHTSIVFQLMYKDTTAHVLNVKDVTGVKIVY